MLKVTPNHTSKSSIALECNCGVIENDSTKLPYIYKSIVQKN